MRHASMLGLLGTAAFVLLPAALHAAPITVAVGSCDPSVNTYPTIGAAIAAVAAGSRVEVCPGSYPEQVVINKALTLVGTPDATGALPQIVAPPGGFVQSTTDYEKGIPVAAQILATGGGKITISGLSVDGAAGNFSGTGCSLGFVGIYIQDAPATISNNAVLNTTLGAGLQGCQSGLAIYAQSQSKPYKQTVSGNRVAGFDKNGITFHDGNISGTISGNTVTGMGATNIVAQNGIELAFGGTGTVTGNTIGQFIYAPLTYAAAGILIYDSAGARVVGNTVSRVQYGIAAQTDGTPESGLTVSGNQIAHAENADAIDSCGIDQATITKNVISGAFVSGVHLDGTCDNGAAQASAAGNIITLACAGVLNTAAGTVGKNTYYAVQSDVLNQDSCGSSQSRIPAHRPTAP